VKENYRDGAARVALAAMLHDLGKLAERARIEASKESVESNSHQYCPRQEVGGRHWFSHKHAAYTAIAMDHLESEGLLPPIKGRNLWPFSSWGEGDDSLINAAARHHKPETLLQWIVATADRVASGFEREQFDEYNRAEENRNHYTARMLTLFEQVRISPEAKKGQRTLQWRYPLRPMSVDSLMPQQAEQCEGADNSKAQQEYHAIWDSLIEQLGAIPESHRSNLSLWLDHFDSCWGAVSHAIPSATAFGAKPEVSLYDHTRATTALATALWSFHAQQGREHEEDIKALRSRDDWGENKLLLIQGDLFGIQDFIFSTGGETRKRAAKLLRGRSFQVALMTECASLRILDLLGLPPTSQVINAAGKFLIVAPNTAGTRERLQQVRKEMEQWFLRNTWGQAGVGVAAVEASCNDFLAGSSQAGGQSAFEQLQERLFTALDQARRQRFDLCSGDSPICFTDFPEKFDPERGPCAVDGISPAVHELEPGVHIGIMARDQIDIGRHLVDKSRLLISREPLDHNTLQLDLLGYYISFTDDEEASGKFGRVAAEGTLLRVWDYTLPKSGSETLFHGYARRAINGYVPRFTDDDSLLDDKYERLKGREEELDLSGSLKTLNHIACEDLWLDEQGRWVGVDALMTLKGDVDNLGKVFQGGVGKMTFAKMAALSRQVNAFFSTWLPWYCSQHEKYRNTYTVFAGGDDFFLIGPWRTQMNLALEMRRVFSRYVAGNRELHFSAGLSMSRPGLPIRHLAVRGESALESAKEHGDHSKNAVTCHGWTVGWDDFEQLDQAAGALERLADEYRLSTGYLYGMIYLAEMAENVSVRPENALWHSRFAYRTRRMVERMRGLDAAGRDRVQQQITGTLYSEGINRFGGSYMIALTSYLYKHRKTGA